MSLSLGHPAQHQFAEKKAPHLFIFQHVCEIRQAAEPGFFNGGIHSEYRLWVLPTLNAPCHHRNREIRTVSHDELETLD